MRCRKMLNSARNRISGVTFFRVCDRNPILINLGISRFIRLKISVDQKIPQRYNSPFTRTPYYMFEIEQRLLNNGITIDDIVDAAMGLYVSHGMPEDQASVEIKRKIIKYLANCI